jgi:protease-4
VDEIGDLDDAIAAAAELAGLDAGTFGQTLIEKELSPGEQLVVDFLGTARNAGIDPAVFVRKPSASMQRLTTIVNALTPLMRFNDPKGIYSHCFCAFE